MSYQAENKRIFTHFLDQKHVVAIRKRLALPVGIVYLARDQFFFESSNLEQHFLVGILTMMAGSLFQMVATF